MDFVKCLRECTAEIDHDDKRIVGYRSVCVICQTLSIVLTASMFKTPYLMIRLTCSQHDRSMTFDKRREIYPALG